MYLSSIRGYSVDQLIDSLFQTTRPTNMIHWFCVSLLLTAAKFEEKFGLFQLEIYWHDDEEQK